MHSKYRRGVITSITTLIIIVASVVMGTGLVTFGTSVFKAESQQQNIVTQNVKIWVDPTNQKGVAWGAAGIRNIGEVTISVDKIQVRGTFQPFTNWYVEKNQSAVTTNNFQAMYETPTTTKTGIMKSDLSLSSNSQCANVPTNIKIDFDGATGSNPMLCLQKANGPVSLNPGEKMIVYFQIPNGVINTIDTGESVSVDIFAQMAGGPLQVSIGNTNQESRSATFVFLIQSGFPDEPSLISLYHKHASSTDIVAQFANGFLDNNTSSQISGQKATTYFSLVDIQNNANTLHANGYAWVVYDLEPGGSPANEIADPVGSVQQAAQIAHSNGLKLMITPAGIPSQYFGGMASYADGYVLQEQDLINGNLAVMTNITQQAVNIIRASNPNEIIILQGSMIKDTPDQINAAYDATKSMVDGITLFYHLSDNDIPLLAQVYTHIDGIN